MGEVDPAFIQDTEHRPKVAGSFTEAEGIPLIDLSALMNYPDDHRAIECLVEAVRSASKDWGFFRVINHGVPPEKLRRVEEAARKFFGLPLDEKRKVRKDESVPLGYYETEHTKNVRDWREVFDFTVQDPTPVPASYQPDDEEVTQWSNKWPEYPPELREACEEYAKAVEKLAFRLLEVIAMSLGLPGDRFHFFFREYQISYIRLNNYPPCPAPHLALGLGRHKDSGALTILAQDKVGGLEVKRKSDGEWIRVMPTPDTYIINVGDIIQVWSNDAYESVEHRVVVNPEKERFSIPYFFNPAHNVMVEPLPELVTKQNPARYRPYSWGKFLVTRKRGNLTKLDVENIQISHFRVSEKEDTTT